MSKKTTIPQPPHLPCFIFKDDGNRSVFPMLQPLPGHSSFAGELILVKRSPYYPQRE